MHCHCGTNNRTPRWTFTDPCKPEVRPGAREESASPAWLAAPARCDDLNKKTDTAYLSRCVSVMYNVLEKKRSQTVTLTGCSYLIDRCMTTIITP